MASEKLYELAVEGGYDLVVVDTPPTRNALDFIDAPQRLAQFLSHPLYRVLMTPTRGIVKAVNVAAQAITRSIAKVVGAEVIGDAIAFFAAFEGMEAGFAARARHVQQLLGDESTAFVLVASPKADTVAEADYFAGRLQEQGIAVRALVVNRMQPAFADPVESAEGSADDGVRVERLATAAAALRARAASLSGTALGDLYTCLADARELARDEESHLTGLASRLNRAPLVRVPVQPFEVTDLTSLDALGDVLFAERS
jgi:anion-transporting  ArsA/GET3 family ATPase